MKSIVAQEIADMGAAVPFAFEVKFADGSYYRNRDETSRFSIHFLNHAAEWGIAAFGHVGMIEGYIDGVIDVDGDLHAAFQAGLNSGFDAPGVIVTERNRWHEFRHSNASPAQARTNARAHYGLGTEFFRPWLDDPYMMYTCGYWPEGTATLEQAQVNKMEHVCRKIRLGRDESVVDIGCGFGGFMFYAAAEHGAAVTGVNTTSEQVAYVDAEIGRRNLRERLSVVEADFRDASGPYDKVVSIGVLEHAGRDQLREVVEAHARFLKSGGLGMLHFIGHVGRRDTEFFIREHVFPGGWIPSLAEVIVAMEDSGLEILDIENLRRHYALTLDEWARRFDRSWDRIHALDPQKFTERLRRAWRCYLVGCAEMFRAPAERTHLFQIVFSKGNCTIAGYPMGRDFLYTAGTPRIPP